MPNYNNLHKDRPTLLAFVSELYFLEGKTQAKIAKIIGVTRSNVSRMLLEARNSGIVHIQINWPIRENTYLTQQLVERFNLLSAHVLIIEQYSDLLKILGKAAGEELTSRLKPNFIIGTSWGTAVSTSVDNIEISTKIHDIKVVQLLGAMGARNKQYDAHAIVQRLANKFDAEGIYLNAPFIVEDPDVAKSLLSNNSIQETLSFGDHVDIALLGVGSSDLEHNSYYLANYVHRNEILEIQESGAIGDVCGRFYDLNGNMAAKKFQDRLIGISLDSLMNIPVRIGVAGGLAKVHPILGALRGGLINVLVSDERTIIEVLKQND